jgi:putative two-component system response regulator
MSTAEATMRMFTLLIVDDEPSNLSIFVRLLSPLYQVRACKSGAQAVVAAHSAPRPDLILLDVMMPDMDGYAVLAQLRADATTRDIPVVFVTALSEDLDEERGLALGAVDYLVKPVRPAIMLARVRNHLEMKQARDQLSQQNDWLELEVARRTRETLLIQDVSLSVVLELAETRDNETGNHILRTQTYVELLGRQLQHEPTLAAALAEPRLSRIVKAAPLHDIGKIGIPDCILLKPGKLNAEEWTIMQTHSRLGAEALRRAIKKSLQLNQSSAADACPEALAILEVAQAIAASHHEKWDGSGYPDGLAGDAIPLAARLMALADVYDALTMRRVYKEPWTSTAAAEYLNEQAGRHFDPLVVAAFHAIAADFADVAQRFSDPV